MSRTDTGKLHSCSDFPVAPFNIIKHLQISLALVWFGKRSEHHELLIPLCHLQRSCPTISYLSIRNMKALRYVTNRIMEWSATDCWIAPMAFLHLADWDYLNLFKLLLRHNILLAELMNVVWVSSIWNSTLFQFICALNWQLWSLHGQYNRFVSWLLSQKPRQMLCEAKLTCSPDCEMLMEGYRNITWGIIENSTQSLYGFMRQRNLCNHRDYQNLGVNGKTTFLFRVNHKSFFNFLSEFLTAVLKTFVNVAWLWK